MVNENPTTPSTPDTTSGGGFMQSLSRGPLGKSVRGLTAAASLWVAGAVAGCNNEADPHFCDKNPDACYIDNDRDGHFSELGEDCDDNDPDVHVDAPEVPYDGIDNDCDGEDLTDVDGDGYDAQEVGGTDCDDNDPNVHGPSLWGPDGDEDGFADASASDEFVEACEDDAPEGLVNADGDLDCDDNDNDNYPGALEVCNDGEDNDCDGQTDEADANGVALYIDNDRDGYGGEQYTLTECPAEIPEGSTTVGGDCDDYDPMVNPGMDEAPYPNGVDDDCDGEVDEGTNAYDDDGDGFSERDGDCDDNDASASPDGSEGEVGDGVDNDCDNVVDEGTNLYDDDGDGMTENEGDCNDGDPSVYTGASETPYDGVDQDCSGSDLVDVDADGYSASEAGGSDCNDGDATVNPGAAEIADGIDQNCNGTIDEGTNVYDDDGDGYTEDAGDCDDAAAGTHPGAAETADGTDENCNGTVDEGTNVYDDDGDGYTEDAGDCDDADDRAHPGATESADGIDNDCDGTVDEGTDAYDDDGDGYTENDGDCDDTDPSVNPDATEVYYDGVDNDCDAGDGTDFDGDGHDSDAVGGDDCDDDDIATYAGAPEIEDGADNDCDGTVDEGTEAYDDDGDGYSENDGDCDDADATVSPVGVETADGTDEDCDGTIDEGTEAYDDDGDGFTELEGDCNDGNADINPDAEETPYDGIDSNCDGLDPEDQDGDGHNSDIVGGDDCDDEDATVYPGAADMPEDGIDSDCDGDPDNLGEDYDADGLTNEEEMNGTYNDGDPTDPTDADSDDDELLDGDEIDEGTDPNDSDSDDDGRSDGMEVALETDPLNTTFQVADTSDTTDWEALVDASDLVGYLTGLYGGSIAFDMLDSSDPSAYGYAFLQHTGASAVDLNDYGAEECTLQVWLNLGGAVDYVYPMVGEGSDRWKQVLTQDLNGDTLGTGWNHVGFELASASEQGSPVNLTDFFVSVEGDAQEVQVEDVVVECE